MRIDPKVTVGDVA